MIHLGLQVLCFRFCYCCHFLWRHSRCIGLTVPTVYFTYFLEKRLLNVLCEKEACIHWKQKYLLCFNNFVYPHPPTHIPPLFFSITKGGWNGRQEHGTSAETDRSAVNGLLASSSNLSGQSQTINPATSCPVQGRNYSNQRQRGRYGWAQRGKSMLPILTINIFKSKITYHTMQPIVTYGYNPFHTHHRHNIHASM